MASKAMEEFLRRTQKAPTEMDRVLGLPLVADRGEDERAAVREAFPGKTINLRDVQCDAILSLLEVGTLFGPIGVGHGKTLITLLAGKVLGSERNMILVPPEVANQLVKRDIPMAMREFQLEMNYCSLYRMSKQERSNVDFSNYDCIIFPYSLLSVVDTYDLLERICPDLVCADECHMLRNSDSARTKRLMSYLAKSPEVPFVCLSGTITKRSIFDYRHLIKRCLGEGSPLPDSYATLSDWNSFLGVRQYEEESQRLTKAEVNSFRPMRDWYMNNYGGRVEHSRESYREVFSARLRTTPGVVQTSNQSVDASLRINNSWGLDWKVPNAVAEAILDAEASWTTPNGDELEDAMHLAALKAQLCSGFYYKLEWPEGTPDWVLEQHEKHNTFKSAMRKWLKRGVRKGCDTPMLVYNALGRRDSYVAPLQEEYDLWKEAILGEVPDRLQSAVWLDGWKIRMAESWLDENDGIVWYLWDVMGKALAQAIPGAQYCPAGCDITSFDAPKVIASINAHHVGKNLQHHYKQLVLEVPRSGSVWEQLLGRTHRQGQLEDTVYVDVAAGVEFEFDRLGLAYLDSQYIEQTGFGLQKMSIADFSVPYSEEEIHGKVCEDPGTGR